MAKRYAHAFGVSWTWLLGGEEFDEVTNLLTGIPVVGILDPEAFRVEGAKLPGYPDEIYAQFVGYNTADLRAFSVYGSSDLHFVIVAAFGDWTPREGDEYVIRRVEAGRFEFAAWRFERINGQTKIVPAYAPHVSITPHDVDLLDGEGTSIEGVVVGELKVKRRAQSHR
ncbi:hypothetical protein LRS10_09545 [Phenylobacterium sp. J426]|nr:hypothetical protein [Phenylobacterium sp. J426]